MDVILNQIVSNINLYLWNYLIIFILIGAGLFFTMTTGAVQIRMFKEMVRLVASGAGTKTDKNHVSSFQAFCVSTASRVGVGNIAGIAIAVVLGGPGAIFWMWVIALIGSATGFIESTLAQIYKEPIAKGGFYGGPAYYIRYGLNSKFLSILFAILITITFGWIYNSVQANTLAASLHTFGIDVTYTGIVVSVLLGLIIFGGIQRVAKISEIIVPIMAVLYIGTALFVVLMNIQEFPAMIHKIVSSAFDPYAAGGGFMGATMMNGIKRGLFSNEAGEGSVPNAAATAAVHHPVEQGLVQAFGVFLDTFIICTSSAFIVLIVGDYSITGLTGIALVQHNLEAQLGAWAPYAVTVFIIMFSFSSLVGNYYYGEININHLTDKKYVLHLFRIGVVAMAFIGSIASLDLVWNLADLFMAFLVLTNVSSILRMGRTAGLALDDYIKQRKAGIQTPVFNRNVLNHTYGIVWWGDGQTTDSSVPATPLEETIEK
ncbi:alanine/glycine:cation symporter family protein [Veillonella caviae]|uniref:alanine/glycine:cation symporter family protein n=3 Tax=Veillonella caviae TaxID=248316 RepID=UPI000F8F3228|nr:alanine/glycine:cation symporter family protein [Veillonella caviae]MCI5708216.1 alanine:cation symporter family protein [Veillonella caviae]MCI7694399.1 alanine:cation symporter family protein [Veillonella caviae]MDD7290973.1 alanine/glycine:cation symporter family protein [Veillonella caviae]MDY5254741.1 alanine/glycine:cation symporter family protein [Veillonella caviae]MDY5409496.1 alanine/glycine:cation symporter family protein [Veillonella caviae]